MEIERSIRETIEKRRFDNDSKKYHKRCVNLTNTLILRMRTSIIWIKSLLITLKISIHTITYFISFFIKKWYEQLSQLFLS